MPITHRRRPTRRLRRYAARRARWRGRGVLRGCRRGRSLHTPASYRQRLLICPSPQTSSILKQPHHSPSVPVSAWTSAPWSGRPVTSYHVPCESSRPGPTYFSIRICRSLTVGDPLGACVGMLLGEPVGEVVGSCVGADVGDPCIHQRRTVSACSSVYHHKPAAFLNSPITHRRCLCRRGRRLRGRGAL